MVAKKAEAKDVNVMDVFWDSWFNSFKTFQSIQNNVEQNAFQVLENQKEWIQTSSKQLSKMEQETKKITSEWQNNITEALQRAQKEFEIPTLSDWEGQYDEISDRANTLTFSPGKASLEMLSKSHAHLENTFKNALDQQQKNREEVIRALEGFVDQLKQTQNGMLKSFDMYNPLVASK